ncbi:MAG: acireductone synthase [Candidatus Berkiella sp.]
MIKAIITDIEGTTTDINFVHKVLFPYSRERMADFVRTHKSDPQIAPLLEDIRKQLPSYADLTMVIKQLIDWIDQDVKNGALKSIQGFIWKAGFEKGDFTGHVYQDAYENLLKWHQQGIALYVYSSGSVQAQQLLFGFSDFGDLRYLFKGYFDTAIGGKKEAASYAHIIKEIGFEPNEILFLSDVKAELDAAKANNIRTYLLDRAHTELDIKNHPVIGNFNVIQL